MTEPKNDLTEIFGDVIFSYTRQDAIEDGVLIDLSNEAQELGIMTPVAMTSEAYDKLVEVYQFDDYKKASTTNILKYLLTAMKRNQSKEVFLFDVAKNITLKAMLGFSDPTPAAKKTITIMFPHED